MAFHKAAIRAASVCSPAPEAINLEAALKPLMEGLGKNHSGQQFTDYDAWLSSDPTLVQYAAPPQDSMFVGRRSEREMLCFVMKKVLSKSSNERRVILFTGPSGVGKTSAVKHAMRYMMNETSGLEGSPDVIVESLRGRAIFFEEDIVNLAINRNVVVRAGMNPDLREDDSLALLGATLLDAPYIILLDDADDEGLKKALELLPASRKGSAIFITSQTLDEATVMKELVAAGDNNGAPTLFAHEVKPFTPKESLTLLVRACSPHTHRGLYNQLDELKLILGDGPDPMHHLGHLPLAVRTFAEWASEQFQRYMRSQTPQRVQEMVARWLLVGQANAERLNQPFDREGMAVKLKASIEDGATAGLAVLRTWKDHVERTHDPPKGKELLRCCHTAIGLKMKHMEEAIPFEYQHPCAQLLQLLALCPSDNVPWSLFDGGPNGENNVFHRGARVQLHGFVKATANNGRRGKVMDVYKDGSVSVVFGCDWTVLSPALPGAEIARFKVGNVQLAGPLGLHEELMSYNNMQDVLVATAALEKSGLPHPPPPTTPPPPPPYSDMEPALHDPQELKKVAAYLKAVMPTVVHVDEVRRTFSMHEIVAGQIRQGLGCQTDRMRALLHARCGQLLDEAPEPKLHKILREVTCVAADLACQCRRLGNLEGEGWGCAMLLRVFQIARHTWGEESLVTTRCMTLAHAVIVADICHQWLMSNTIQSSIKELCDVPSVREMLDVCMGPFSFVRCMRLYLGPDSTNKTNPSPNRLKIMSWRFRALRGTVETDEKVLQQISETLAEGDPLWYYNVSAVQMEAMVSAAQRLSSRGLADRSLRMFEQALQKCVEIMGAEHTQTRYIKLQLLAQRKKMAEGLGGSVSNPLQSFLSAVKLSDLDSV